MLLDDRALVYAVLFIGVLLLVEGVWQLIAELRSGPRAQVNRRMQMLAGGRDGHEVLATLRREGPDGGGGLGRFLPLLTRLDRLVAQAGLSVPRSRLLLGMLALGGGAFIALEILTGARPSALILPAALAGVGLPVLWLMRRRQRRIRMFEEQLPGALDLLVRSLRVGHPLSSALAVVAREMPDPLGSEFGVVVDEITYGQELEDALERMNARVDLQDLRYLTVAIQIQHGSGGNLAEVLAGLAAVIRDRFQMFRKIRAITAEGRWSSWFLSLFPLFMIVGMQLVRPDYYTEVADHPLFPILVVVTGVLLVVNVVFMRLLTNFKV
jgi:tight adherence protein B